MRKYAIPAIIAMTASSLYNMIDSIFIGQGVGPLAISGLAVTFPLMNISAAFGSLVGVGASAIVSMLLGQKNYGVARRVLGNVMTMNVVLGVLLMFFGLLFLDPILFFFGASENIISYAREYMIYILLGNVITHLYLGLNAVLRAAGRPKVAMWLTILTVVLNAILDPLFIFVFDMGIKGAAIATVLAQTVSLVWQLRLLNNKNEVLHFENGKVFTYDRKIARESLKIGLSPFLMNMASCFVVLLINNQLRRYGDQMGEGVGDIAIGAYGQPHHLPLCDDCDGLQPRYATHCRLQLRCRQLRPSVEGLLANRWMGNAVYHSRLCGGSVCAGGSREVVYQRCDND